MRLIILVVILTITAAELTPTKCLLEKYQEYDTWQIKDACWWHTDFPTCWTYNSTETRAIQIWSFNYTITYRYIYNNTDPNKNIIQGNLYDCYFNKSDPQHSLRFGNNGAENIGEKINKIFKIIGIIICVLIGVACCVFIVMNHAHKTPPIEEINLREIVVEQKIQTTINHEIKQKTGSLITNKP